MRSFPGKIRPTEASATMVIEVNSNGGVYAHGKTFPYEKKAQIAMVYNQMIANNEPVSARSLAKKAGVGKTFANNIISEIKAFGDVVQPPDAKERDIPHGAGSKTLSLIEESKHVQYHRILRYRRFDSMRSGLLHNR